MKRDRRKYQREYQRRRRWAGEDKYKEIYNRKLTEYRNELKQRAVEYKGGICFRCEGEYDLVCFDFHHIDHTKKDINISNILHKPWAEVVRELDRCVLLCSNCHRVLHKEKKYDHFNNKKTGKTKQMLLFEQLDEAKSKEM